VKLSLTRGQTVRMGERIGMRVAQNSGVAA
jgi:hypothetical protein